MSEMLAWLNLLLIPTCAGVLSLVSRLAALEATQRHHAARLNRLDGIRQD